MSLTDAATRLEKELELPPGLRRFGSGWLSGTLGLILACASLLIVVALRYHNLLADPDLQAVTTHPLFRPGLHLLLASAFLLSALSLLLRGEKILGGAAMSATLAASLIAGLPPTGLSEGVRAGGAFFGLDFFVLNVLFTGFLFVPFERLFPRAEAQRLFRAEWREDLFYYLVSSMLVQSLTFLAFAPSHVIVALAPLQGVRSFCASLPWAVQVIAIMFLTDAAQYWVHWCFHRFPALWEFHAVHHSAKSLDWIAGARMHFLEIVILRAVTATPMLVLGFDPSALQAYILIVYVYSSFIHANVGLSFGFLERILVSPRFHHWHHAIEKEAIDVNFALHFTFLDRLFGTYRMPEGRWPSGYGISGHPVPRGYWPQFLYPFRRAGAAK
jgi:sterol desaturase/sphingolipid hydroxylase (fatty acid hydroxylase superfamily)